MTPDIQGRSPLETWRSALEYVHAHGDQMAMTYRIEQASCRMPYDLDPHLLSDKHPPLVRTSGVIFPSEGDWNEPPELFLAKMLPSYVNAEWGRWGSYFERLTAPGAGAKMENPLLHHINCLRQRWGKEAQSVFTLHITGSFQDKPQPQGNPCLQYIQIIRNENRLSLVFAYRAHDVFGRALGNFIGLSRLLTYICHHTRFEVGGLVGIAGRAYSSGTKADRIQLLNLAKDQS